MVDVKLMSEIQSGQMSARHEHFLPHIFYVHGLLLLPQLLMAVGIAGSQLSQQYR
jgi:hypothetical protein